MDRPLVTVGAGAAARAFLWLSGLAPAPARAGLTGDRARADTTLRRLRAGEALLYQGDYRNARQLLSALGRRLEPRPERLPPAEAFRRERARRAEAQELLLRLLVPVEPGWRIALARAPDLSAALGEALGPPPEAPGLLPLREVLGAAGAHEWRRKGLFVEALGASVHPHHGVFAPVRGEYLELVARALASRQLAGRLAFDVGTGTGVLAFLAARRGARVIATDAEPQAVACARENAVRLGLAAQVEVREGNLFPEGRADLVLCNPPWVPAEPSGPLDRAVYDPGSRFLLGFLGALPAHLALGGEALLVISDLAERLGLRPTGFLAEMATRAGLSLQSLDQAAPAHPRARDAADALAEARRAEVTTLYRLRPADG